MFEFPKPDQHTSIIGRNGSGKTQIGSWLLSESDFDRRPHVIIDFKRDELLNAIPYKNELDKTTAPKKPGIYIYHWQPGDDDRLEELFWNIWAQENTDVHVDETYMVDRNSKAFNAMLTQGRSKKVSLRCLTQRPSYCSRFVFSESTHFSVFHMNDIRDQKIIGGFTPINFNETKQPFHSHWYDVRRNLLLPLLPVPDSDSILNTFEDALKPKRKFI